MTRELEFWDTVSEDAKTICPYCEYEQENEYQDLSYEHDAEDHITCDHCEKEYIASVYSITIERHSVTMENALEEKIAFIERRISVYKDLIEGCLDDSTVMITRRKRYYSMIKSHEQEALEIREELKKLEEC